MLPYSYSLVGKTPISRNHSVSTPSTDEQQLDQAFLLIGKGEYEAAYKICEPIANNGNGNVNAQQIQWSLIMNGQIANELAKQNGILSIEVAAEQNNLLAQHYLQILWKQGEYDNSKGILVQDAKSSSLERQLPPPFVQAALNDKLTSKTTQSGELTTLEQLKALFREGPGLEKVELKHVEALKKVWDVVCTHITDKTGYEFDARLEFSGNENNSPSGELNRIFLWVADTTQRDVAKSLMSEINKAFGIELVQCTEKRRGHRCLILDAKRLPLTQVEHEPHLSFTQEIQEEEDLDAPFPNYSCSEFEALERPGKEGRPVIFPYAKFDSEVKLNEKTLKLLYFIANKITINSPYHFKLNGFDLNRPNHNGTHAARQLALFEYAIEMIATEGNEKAKELLSTLTTEQILAAKLAVFFCRAGRVDESSSKSKGKADCYLERSAQLFELYAYQTDLPEEVIQSSSKMITHAYDNENTSGFTEAQLMLINFMNAAHTLDLYRCSSEQRMERELKFANTNLQPYFDNNEALLERMITYSKAILTSTGVDLSKHCGYASDLYRQCSEDMELCFEQIDAVDK